MSRIGPSGPPADLPSTEPPGPESSGPELSGPELSGAVSPRAELSSRRLPRPELSGFDPAPGDPATGGLPGQNSPGLGLPRRADRIVVMGVLNVTPDSFSDGGRYTDLDDALSHAREMTAEGADLIDVGGESTRPGAERVPAAEEARRVLPVIGRLAAEGIAISVDTYRAEVAEQALAAGATVVNDVSGGLGDPDMARVVRDAGCPWILMHWRGHSRDMNSLASYSDVVADVRAELSARLDAALAAGVSPDKLVIDPGLGFAKRAEHNWALLARFETLTDLGLPVLLGASRKSFLGRLLTDADGAARPSWGREDATAALTTFAALNGAWGVRVHQVRPNVDAALVAAALQAAGRKRA